LPHRFDLGDDNWRIRGSVICGTIGFNSCPVFHISDGLQWVVLGALRGWQDVKIYVCYFVGLLVDRFSLLVLLGILDFVQSKVG